MSDQLVDELAGILLTRYYEASASSQTNNRRSRYRVVVVVGAGASHAACGLKTGRDTAAAIRAHVGKRVSTSLVEAELARLQYAFGLDRSDLETQLLAFSRFDPSAVVRQLNELFLFEHYPCFTYEVLAHLLKHRFVDAIINFNFDELLDQAVEEELGAGRYAKVVFEGDCARELELLHDGRWQIDRPLYLKPHGTASEPTSLRFTREAYFTMPRDINAVLSSLLAAPPKGRHRPVGRRSSVATPLCVIALGHGMQSFEFNQHLGNAPSGSRLYVLDPHYPKTATWPQPMADMFSDRWIRLTKRRGLDDTMREVYRGIERECAANRRTNNSLVPPRGVHRHDLVARLFRITRSGVLLRRNKSTKLRIYLRDRVLVELALAVAKARGFVDARELAKGRVGRLVRQLEVAGARPRLEQFLRQLELKRRDASRDSYWHATVLGEPAGPNITLTLDDDTFHTLTLPAIKNRLNKLLSPRRRVKLNSAKEPKTAMALHRALTEMFMGEEVEVVPLPVERLSAQFHKAIPLPTFATFRSRTDDLMRKKWSMILCVAESGQWILSHGLAELSSARGQQRIGLIVADGRLVPKLKKVGVDVRWLPWYLHNRHMTIFLKKGRTGFRPEIALYYERRYRSASIAPLELGASKVDARAALDDFVVYWLKAEQHSEGLSEDVHITLAQLSRERRRILDEIYYSVL